MFEESGSDVQEKPKKYAVEIAVFGLNPSKMAEGTTDSSVMMIFFCVD